MVSYSYSYNNFETALPQWEKHQKHMLFTGWCGPATIQMALSYAGIAKSQVEIALYTYKPWWGTSQQLMLAYFSKYFKVVNYKSSSTIADIKSHLNKEHVVIVNWWDNLSNEDDGEGHYSIIGGYHKKSKSLLVVDSSRQRNPIWLMPVPVFKSKWYDGLDLNNRVYMEGWMLWIDPKSIIKK